MEVKAKVQAGGTTQRSLMENKVQKHTGSYLIPQRGLGSLPVGPLCLHSRDIRAAIAACAQE